MGELLSVVNGMVIGVFLGQLKPAPRLSLALLLAISIGAIATLFGVVFRVGPIFFSLYLPLITLSASLSLLWARRRFVYARQQRDS